LGQSSLTIASLNDEYYLLCWRVLGRRTPVKARAWGCIVVPRTGSNRKGRAPPTREKSTFHPALLTPPPFAIAARNLTVISILAIPKYIQPVLVVPIASTLSRTANSITPQHSPRRPTRPQTSTMTEYTSLKVPELKKLLQERGLAATGNKADLVARLQEDDKTKEAPAAAPEAAAKTGM